jgi:hypothetical protein
MTVRLQADCNLNLEIVTGLIRREPAVDFKTADEAGLRDVSDPDRLPAAASVS